MNRNVLIIQPTEEAGDKLSTYFSERGDSVTVSTSVKAAGQHLKISLPDLLLIDITLLGSKWDSAISTLRERFQRTQIQFTYCSTIRLPKNHLDNLAKWKVLTLPITEKRLEKALAGELSKFDILEPLQKKPRLTYPIRFQISFPYLILTLFFALAATFITTKIVFGSAEERYSNQLIEAGKISSELMVIEEENLLESLRLITNTIGLPEEVKNEELDNLHRLIYPHAVNAHLEAIEIVNPAGVSIYSLHHQDGSTIEDYQMTTGSDQLSSSEIIQKINSAEVDEFGDKFAFTTVVSGNEIFFVAGPINFQGEVIGIALIGKTLPSLVKDMRETTLAQTTLYDLSGNVLASTFISNEKLQSDFIPSIISRQDYESLTQNKTLVDITYTEILAPWEVRNDLDIGVLGVALPQNFLVNTGLITKAQIFIALGVFITLVLVIGYRLSNRISKPLEQLAKASEQVSKGNFLVTLEAPGSKEVALLNGSFNDMLKSLEGSQKGLIEAYDNSLQGWSRALSLRDHDTDVHSRRVVDLSVAFAQELGFEGAQLEDIRRGALLHDIGKVGIPDKILRKSGELTDEEWALMKKHPIYAVEILKPVQFLKDALEIPLYHHEQWDGNGYPYGLLAEKIPLSARLFAIADVYDALITNRPYRNAWSKREAIEYIVNNRGKHFDPELVDSFIGFLKNNNKF